MLKRVSDELFIALDPVVRLGIEEVAFLKEKAAGNSRRRARICAHQSNEDRLHEMLIAIAQDSYIRPHRHVSKSESFHVVEGLVDVVFFDDSGHIEQVVELGPCGAGRKFFYRLAESRYHTLVLRSPFLVIHEVTNGPFVPSETIHAPFAPREEEAEAARRYMAAIAQSLNQRARDGAPS